MALFDPPSKEELEKSSGKGLFAPPPADVLDGGTGSMPQEGEYTQPYAEKAASQEAEAARLAVGKKNTKPVDALAVKVKPGMSFEEIARAYNYDPDLLRRSPWFAKLGGEKMFNNPDTFIGRRMQIDKEADMVNAHTQIPKNVARAAAGTVEGVEQFVEHGINWAAGGEAYAPTVALHDLITKVRASNWEHNVNKGKNIDPKTGKETFFNENRIGESLVPLGIARKAKAAVAANAATRYQPAVAAEGAMSQAMKQGAVGGLVAPQTASSPDVGGKSDDFMGTALGSGIVGAALGPAIVGTGKVAAGVAGKISNMGVTVGGKQVGRSTPSRGTDPALTDIANELNTPYRLGDVMPRRAGLVGVENYVTPPADIAATQDAAHVAAQGVVEDAKLSMAAQGWGDMRAVEAAARNPRNTRHADAVEVLKRIENPSEDWSENLAASAKLEILKANIRADQQYARVDTIGRTVTDVPTDNYRLTMDAIVAKREASANRNQRTQQGAQRKLGNNPYLDYLEELQKKQGETFATFEDARLARRDLNSEMEVAKGKAGAGTDAEVRADFDMLREARLQDMKDAANKARKPYLVAALERADQVYAETAKVRESILAKELEKRPDLADEVLPVFLRSQLGSGHDRGAALYKSLGPRGREAVKYALLDNELRNSLDNKGYFHPADFAAGLRDKGPLLDSFLTGQDKQKLDGMKKFFAHLDRIDVNSQTKNAEMRARSGLGAAGVGAGQMSLTPSAMMAVVGQALGSVGAARLINSPRMQRFWLASSDLFPGSKAMDALSVEITNALAREAGNKGGEKVTDKVTRRK